MAVGEFLVLAIVLGAVIVFMVRRRVGSEKAANEELVVSTSKLRQELERTGDEIIGRIDKQVGRLEKLVADADERYVKLKNEETRLDTLEQELAQQITEGHILSQRLKRQTTTAVDEASRVVVSAAQEQSYPPKEQSPQELPQDDFSAVLARSMQKKEASLPEEDMPSATNFAPLVAPVVTSKQPTDFAQPEGQIAISDLADSGAGKARLLLQQGLSIEDVAKETGMGRGAVELLQQMVRRQRKN